MTILIAGIGNIFLGDDAFGVEVAQLLAHRSWPSGVSVNDFGIRGLDLCYALTEEFDAFILIDAVPRGEAPGTLYTIEIDPAAIEASLSAQPALDAHGLNPVSVLQIAKAMGAKLKRVLLVGCEPEPLSEQDLAEGRMGLSDPVSAAVLEATAVVRDLVEQLIQEEERNEREALEDVDDHSRSGGCGYAVARP
jgi:hydrogenase maturation protease